MFTQKKIIALIFLSFVMLLSFFNDKKKEENNDRTPRSQKLIKTDHQIREVKKADIDPNIDGEANDPVWKELDWYPIDQKWLGPDYDVKDYFGRYKITWTPNKLFLLVEIQDDILVDQYTDPFKLWWDDDCVEIFIDSDNSGGEHQYNNNAFAYHIALDGNVVDLNTKKEPVLYNDHVTSKRKTIDDISVWEFAITLYDNSFIEGKTNTTVTLKKNQKIGFAVAYNDNDGSKERENFIGSVFISGKEKNLGWINADVFGTIILVE